MLGLGWPVLLDPRGTALGGEDFASIAWGFWRVADALPGLPALTTDTIYFPRGATLLVADLPEALLLAPLTLLAGPVAATNLLVALHPPLAGAAAFLLARRHGLGNAGAALAGTAFGLSPVLLAGLHNGNPDTTPLYWVPLAGLASGRATAGWGRAALAGAAVAAGAACNPYVGLMAALAAAALAPRPAGAAESLRLVLAACVAAAGLAALAALTRSTLDAEHAMVAKTSAGSAGAGWLAGFVWPWRGGGKDGNTVHAWYLGLSVLVLAAASRPPRGRWLALVLAGVLLAQGPWLHLGPAPLRLGDHTFALPWAQLPGLRSLALPWRFGALAMLGAGFLAGSAVDRMARGRWLAIPAAARPGWVSFWSLPPRFRSSGRHGAPAALRSTEEGANRLAWLAVLVVALDLLALGGGARLVVTRPLARDGACALLAGLPPGPVVDLPPTRDERYLLAQACHGRPVAQGINTPMPAVTARALEGEAPLVDLQALGYRYLVLHAGAPPLVGPVAASDGAVTVLDLAPR